MRYHVRSIPITTSATPDYSVGDNVGGTFTITPQVTLGMGVKLMTLTVLDQAAQSPGLRIIFFGSKPTGTYTDNSALDLSAADLPTIIGQIKISSSDWEIDVADSYGIVNISGLHMVLGPAISDTGGGANVNQFPNRTIYGAIVADTTYNAGATNDLTLNIGYEEGSD